jgi:hypothetical protein
LKRLGYDTGEEAPDAASERAMTVQEVLLKALSGELHWFRVAEILGMSDQVSRPDPLAVALKGNEISMRAKVHRISSLRHR